MKVIFDKYHGNIELTIFESELLKSPLVNRLHQILQNSTAYLVYPCCKTSRFEHSIGTLNMASKIFEAGLTNSDVSSEFITEKIDVVKEIFNEKDLLKNHVFKNTGKATHKANEYLSVNNITNLGDIINSEKFYKSAVGFIGRDFVVKNGSIGCDVENIDKENKYAFLVTRLFLQQALRVFALFHDIGHLPFSHLFEFAIENVYSELKKKRNGKSKSKSKSDLEDVIKEFLLEDEDIHERVGKQITTYIFTSILSNTLDIEKKLMIIGIEGVMRKIVKKTELLALYEIVSGEIDADRLDFVQRDGSNSGVAFSVGNIDRIVKYFNLIKHDADGRKDKYKFTPSIQSLSDIEELMKVRFSIYKYMVNHHAVKRSDQVLQRLIEIVLLEEDEDKVWKNSLANDSDGFELFSQCIKTAKDVFVKDPEGDDYASVLNSFFQITDFWLLALLSREFRVTKETAVSKKRELLSQFFENIKYYSSLWKRVHNYNSFIEQLGKHLYKARLKLENYKNEEKQLLSFVQKIELLCKECKDVKYNKANEERKRKFYKEIGDNLISFLNKFEEKGEWCRRVESALIDDGYEVMIVKTNLRSGFHKEKMLLANNKNRNELFLFENVSTVKSALENDIDSYIKFFVFAKGIEDKENEKKLIEELCKKIYSTFVKATRSEKEEEKVTQTN